MGNPYGPPPGPPPRQPAWPGPQQRPQPYAAPAPSHRAPSGRRTDNDKNFFGALFDFTFDNFISPKLIKFLFVLMTIVVTLGALAMAAYGVMIFTDDTYTSTSHTIGLTMAVLSPIAWFVGLIVIRLYMELAIVMFKISDDLKDVRDNGSMNR